MGTKLSSSYAYVALLSVSILPAGLVAACSASTQSHFTGSGGAGGAAQTGSTGRTSSSTGQAQGGMGGDISFTDGSVGDSPTCGLTCSYDFHDVVDCDGNLIQHCTGTDGCDAKMGTCTNACQAAANNKQSVGCEYYATNMDQLDLDVCYTAFVANTWSTPAHINVEYAGQTLSAASFGRIPSGSGPSLSYGAFDPNMGIPPGEVVILFLAGGPNGQVQCPSGISPAVPTGSNIHGTSGVGNSFHITSDVPVVAYQMNPYGGGSAAVTGASLLLPTSVWDLNYIAVTASPNDIAPPSMNIVASQDNTHVTMLPTVAVTGGGGKLPPGAANQPYTFTLNKGQHAQFTQTADLTGSIIQSDLPIGFMAGQQCMRAPKGVAYCDHGEQMVPPVKALGNEYVGVMFRPRADQDQAIWHLVGAVDGTQLTYSDPVGGPATLNAGQTVDFITENPFVVKSQDADHPFMLFTYMSGSQWKPSLAGSALGYGDADFVISVPPQQYMADYVFFTDPSYPETNLVVVREKNGTDFQDVTLDCAGTLTGWMPVGEYEYTRIDLIRHDFQGQNGCSNGRHEIKSKGRFGLWVWGWGTPETASFTANVSYGYPGGMNVVPINQLVIPPTPK